MALTGLVAANNLGDVVDIEKTWDNIGDNISASVFVPSPTLDLNFASNKSLVDNVSGQNLITFSRASTGKFVGSNGLIQTAASGVPRFDHDGGTGESLGLLVEEARTNYILNSQNFTDLGYWGHSAGTTVFPNQITAPDGTLSATLIQQDSSTSHHGLAKGPANSVVFVTSSAYTISLFIKKYNSNRITLRESGQYSADGYTKAGLVWDFSTESFVKSIQWNGSSQSIIKGYSSRKLAGGWYWITITIQPGGDSNNQKIYPGVFPHDQTSSLSLDPIPSGGVGITGANYYAGSSSAFAGDGITGVYIWGFQAEIGFGPTSYIPTVASAVTRSADIASITGANFSTWYRQDEGTWFGGISRFTGQAGRLIETTGGGYSTSIRPRALSGSIAFAREGSGELSIAYTLPAKVAASYSAPSIRGAVNGTLTNANPTGNHSNAISNLDIGRIAQENTYLNGTISRIVYYPIRVADLTLQALTIYGPVPSFPYSFSIKGRDILALKEVNKTSTRDFIFIKRLISKAQPRLTTASQYTSSGVALRDAAMPKFAPVTRGNYFFSSGLTLSGTTVQINGTNALSIATSPFSSSTATVPLLFAGLRPQTNWRISEAMASGVVASPESAIPIATGDFLLFMKAGQS